MEAQQSQLEAMHVRLLKLEKQTYRPKKCRIGTLILLAALLVALLSSVPAPAQAPASKQAAAADRISALESKVASISQRLIFLQKETSTLQIHQRK
jgi:hypothetical protein